MNLISTVILPVVRQDATIGQALERLRQEGTSALVVVDDGRPVVVTESSLHNTLVAAGGDRQTLMSRVTARALTPRAWSLFAGSTRSVLASAQDDYVVTNVDPKQATVVTDPKRAAELMQPPRFSGQQDNVAV
jgi:CBS domain-containing protein